MVKFVPYVAFLLTLGQVIVAAMAVTSSSELVDGILQDLNEDYMTSEQVIDASSLTLASIEISHNDIVWCFRSEY